MILWFQAAWLLLITCSNPFYPVNGTKSGKTPYSLGYNMVLINAGSFVIGSPAGESSRGLDEDQYSVILSSDFYMGRYEVTQAQYRAIMGTTPGYFSGANLPVEQVSWYDAIVFCNTLSIKEGFTPAYSIGGETNPALWGSASTLWDAAIWNETANGYRLPTEAEWEYACRAGTTTAYNTGAAINDNTGWYNINSSGTTHEVGRKPANSWGLYDMHGNVWEWCWDWYGVYPTGTANDPFGAVSGTTRVFRGGSWYANDQGLRSANRFDYTPDPGYKKDDVGFRVVRKRY